MRTKILLSAVAALATGSAFATSVSSTSVVTTVNAYMVQGSGEAIFRLETNPSGCYGLWLKRADAGFSSTYALLLAAKSMGASVDVKADNADTITISGNAYCRVERIQLQ